MANSGRSASSGSSPTSRATAALTAMVVDSVLVGEGVTQLYRALLTCRSVGRRGRSQSTRPSYCLLLLLLLLAAASVAVSDRTTAPQKSPSSSRRACRGRLASESSAGSSLVKVLSNCSDSRVVSPAAAPLLAAQAADCSESIMVDGATAAAAAALPLLLLMPAAARQVGARWRAAAAPQAPVAQAGRLRGPRAAPVAATREEADKARPNSEGAAPAISGRGTAMQGGGGADLRGGRASSAWRSAAAAPMTARVTRSATTSKALQNCTHLVVGTAEGQQRIAWLRAPCDMRRTARRSMRLEEIAAPLT